jgi:transposase
LWNAQSHLIWRKIIAVAFNVEIDIDLRRCVNQLSQLLLRYFPQLLRLCSTPDEPWLWALLELAPTPQRAAKLTEKRLKQLLSKHRIRRWTAEKVGQILSAPPLPLAAGSAEAISERALLLLPQLRLLELRRKQVAERTQQLLDHMAASAADFPESQEHRDIPLLLSLPGVGRIITATMLAEGAHSLSLRDYHALRAHAGTAPVTKQSGKSRQVLMRYRCNRRLRNAFYHWARTSIQHDPRSKHHYARLRQVDHNHGRALRGVADRLLAVLIAMLKTGKPYDPNQRSPAGPTTI